MRPPNKHERLISRLSPWRKTTKYTNPSLTHQIRVEFLRRSDAAMFPGYPLTNLDLTNNMLIGRTGLDSSPLRDNPRPRLAWGFQANK